jgi:hypothetical protein
MVRKTINISPIAHVALDLPASATQFVEAISQDSYNKT